LFDAGTLIQKRAGMSNRLRIYLFGGLRVESGEQTLGRFRTRKTGSLLAYLAFFAPRAISREVLVDQFWPDASPEKGRGSLNTAIHSLRAQLGTFSTLPDSFLIADRNLVGLNEAYVWTDVEAFRAYASVALTQPKAAEARQEALALYTGDLLEGYYDDWITDCAIELSEIRDALLELEPGQAKIAVITKLPETSDRLPRLGNLFIGREEELRLLAEMHQRSPLVAIVGLGGVGKTRLAIEFCRRLAESGQIVRLIEFAAAPPDVSLAREILRQSGALLDPSTDPIDQLTNHVTGKTTLVLDNLEHLEDPEEELSQILEHVRNVSLIVTTRNRPALHGAEVFDLPPLPIPSDETELDSLRDNPSAKLFVARAASAAPGFVLHSKNAEAVKALCQKLEGISLAIELAAARAQVYSVKEMLDQMEHPLDFLVTRVKDRADRHRSLRSTFEWSYRHLSPWARNLFPKLATARGGWSLWMAEQVLQTTNLPDLLQELIDASLLRCSESGSRKRFHLHEIIREFGLELLTPEQEREIQSERIKRLLEFIQIDDPNAPGADLKAWLDGIESELENVRDCLGWAIANGHHDEAALIATLLHPFWDRRCYCPEAIVWLEKISLFEDLPRDLIATVHRTLGAYQANAADYASATAHLQLAAAVFQSSGNQVQYASVLNVLGNIMHSTGHLPEAAEYYSKSIEARRSENNPRRLGVPLVNLANVSVDQSEYGKAESLFREALAMGRSEDDPFLIQGTLNNLATLCNRTGRYDEAAPILDEAQEKNETLNHRHGLAHVHLTRAELYYRLNRLEEASDQADLAFQIFAEIGEVRWSAQTQVVRAKVAIAKGDSAIAEELLRQVSSNLNKVEDRRLLSELWTLLGFVCTERDPQNAAKYLLTAFELLKDDYTAAELYQAFVIASKLIDTDLCGVAAEFNSRTGTDPGPLVTSLMSKSTTAMPIGTAVEIATTALRAITRQ
jgi:non-specific serine/threonine protein kinase